MWHLWCSGLPGERLTHDEPLSHRGAGSRRFAILRFLVTPLIKSVGVTAPCSFDITSNVDLQEVDNALNQARKEVAQRYDFKGTRASIEFDPKESKLTLVADDDFKLNALWEIVQTRLVRRNVPVKNLTRGAAQPAANSTVRQEIALQQGIPHGGRARHREVHQGQEAQESAGRHPGRSAPRLVGVEGRAPGGDATAARAGLRRGVAVWELSRLRVHPHLDVMRLEGEAVVSDAGRVSSWKGR